MVSIVVEMHVKTLVLMVGVNVKLPICLTEQHVTNA